MQPVIRTRSAVAGTGDAVARRGARDDDRAARGAEPSGTPSRQAPARLGSRPAPARREIGDEPGDRPARRRPAPTENAHGGSPAEKLPVPSSGSRTIHGCPVGHRTVRRLLAEHRQPERGQDLHRRGVRRLVGRGAGAAVVRCGRRRHGQRDRDLHPGRGAARPVTGTGRPSGASSGGGGTGTVRPVGARGRSCSHPQATAVATTAGCSSGTPARCRTTASARAVAGPLPAQQDRRARRRRPAAGRPARPGPGPPPPPAGRAARRPPAAPGWSPPSADPQSATVAQRGRDPVDGQLDVAAGQLVVVARPGGGAASPPAGGAAAPGRGSGCGSSGPATGCRPAGGRRR